MALANPRINIFLESNIINAPLILIFLHSFLYFSFFISIQRYKNRYLDTFHGFLRTIKILIYTFDLHYTANEYKIHNPITGHFCKFMLYKIHSRARN